MGLSLEEEREVPILPRNRRAESVYYLRNCGIPQYHSVIRCYFPIIISVSIRLVYIFHISRRNGNIADSRLRVIGNISLINIQPVCYISPNRVQALSNLRQCRTKSCRFIVFQNFIVRIGECSLHLDREVPVHLFSVVQSKIKSSILHFSKVTIDFSIGSPQVIRYRIFLLENVIPDLPESVDSNI